MYLIVNKRLAGKTYISYLDTKIQLILNQYLMTQGSTIWIGIRGMANRAIFSDDNPASISFNPVTLSAAAKATCNNRGNSCMRYSTVNTRDPTYGCWTHVQKTSTCIYMYYLPGGYRVTRFS